MQTGDEKVSPGKAFSNSIVETGGEAGMTMVVLATRGFAAAVRQETRKREITLRFIKPIGRSIDFRFMRPKVVGISVYPRPCLFDGIWDWLDGQTHEEEMLRRFYPQS
jgi:hypothetical protein